MTNLELKELLKKTDLKATSTRVAILSVLEQSSRPMCAEELLKELPSMDKVTLYRSLRTFKEKTIIDQVDLRKPSTYYEFSRSHHHHIVCTTCNLIEDFTDCGVEGIISSLLERSSSFDSVNEHALELFGVCSKCSSRQP